MMYQLIDDFNESMLNLINFFHPPSSSSNLHVITSRLILIKDGPYQLLTIISIYLFFCAYFGPKIMTNRKPFSFPKLLLIYNLVLVAVNTYFLIDATLFIYGWDVFNFKFDTEMTPLIERRVIFLYLYFLSKLLDLCDTVFNVLRKKNSHLTLLHIYHHASVPILAWLAVRFASSTGANGIVPIINSFVHMIMYTYYGLSTFGPAIQKYLWWKKYITQIQLGQFILFLTYIFALNYYGRDWPTFLLICSSLQPPLYLILFGLFYYKTYCRGQKNVQKDGQKEGQNKYTNGISITNKNSVSHHENNNLIEVTMNGTKQKDKSV